MKEHTTVKETKNIETIPNSDIAIESIFRFLKFFIETKNILKEFSIERENEKGKIETKIYHFSDIFQPNGQFQNLVPFMIEYDTSKTVSTIKGSLNQNLIEKPDFQDFELIIREEDCKIPEFTINSKDKDTIEFIFQKLNEIGFSVSESLKPNYELIKTREENGKITNHYRILKCPSRELMIKQIVSLAIISTSEDDTLKSISYSFFDSDETFFYDIENFLTDLETDSPNGVNTLLATISDFDIINIKNVLTTALSQKNNEPGEEFNISVRFEESNIEVIIKSKYGDDEFIINFLSTY